MRSVGFSTNQATNVVPAVDFEDHNIMADTVEVSVRAHAGLLEVSEVSAIRSESKLTVNVADISKMWEGRGGRGCRGLQRRRYGPFKLSTV